MSLFAEAFFTHQDARLMVPGGLFTPPTSWRITVDHLLGGGLREVGGTQRVRPFLTGLLGLTRYAAGGDNEVRFTVSAGGGVKLMPVRHIGVRFDGRAETDGSFRIRDVPPGRYRLRTWNATLPALEREIEVGTDSAGPLVLTLGNAE